MATEGSANSVDSPLRKVTSMLDNYITLRLSFVGMLLIVGGYLISLLSVPWTSTQVWAVVFLLWGIALVLLGSLSYGIIRWSHRGTLG